MYISLHMVYSSTLQSICDGNGPTETTVFETSLVTALSIHVGVRIYRKRSHSVRFQKSSHPEIVFTNHLARSHENAKTMVG